MTLLHGIFLGWFVLLHVAQGVLGAAGVPWLAGLIALALTALALISLRLHRTNAAPETAAGAASLPDALVPIAALLVWAINGWFLWSPAIAPSRVQVATFAIGAAFFLGCALRRERRRVFVLGSLVLGALIRTLSYSQVPIHPSDGDMLPLVQAALDRFGRGENPYALYHMPWELPLVYLPLTWLAYLPAHALHLDLRLTNLILEGVIFAALVAAGSDAEERAGNKGRGARLDSPAAALAALLFASGIVKDWANHTTHQIFWVLLALALVQDRQGRPHRAAVLLGACGAASPLSAVIAPLLGLRWLKEDGWARALLRAAIAATVAMGIILPFALRDPGEFMRGVFLWHNVPEHYAYELWKYTHGQAQIGMAPLFVQLGIERFLKPLQAVVFLSLVLWSVLRPPARRDLGSYVAAGFCVFMLFNPLLRNHYWFAGGIALLAAVSLDGQRSISGSRGAASRRPAEAA